MMGSLKAATIHPLWHSWLLSCLGGWHSLLSPASLGWSLAATVCPTVPSLLLDWIPASHMAPEPVDLPRNNPGRAVKATSEITFLIEDHWFLKVCPLLYQTVFRNIGL
jgi:hypothetical protein